MAHSNQGDPTRNPCEDEEVLPGPGPGPDPDPGDPDPEPAVDPPSPPEEQPPPMPQPAEAQDAQNPNQPDPGDWGDRSPEDYDARRLPFSSATRDVTTISTYNFVATEAWLTNAIISNKFANMNSYQVRTSRASEINYRAIDNFRDAMLNFWTNGHTAGEIGAIIFPSILGGEPISISNLNLYSDNESLFYSPIGTDRENLANDRRFIDGIYQNFQENGLNIPIVIDNSRANYAIDPEREYNANASLTAMREVFAFKFTEEAFQRATNTNFVDSVFTEAIQEPADATVARTSFYDLFSFGERSAAWPAFHLQYSSVSPDAEKLDFYRKGLFTAGNKNAYFDFTFDAPAAFFEQEMNSILLTPSHFANIEAEVQNGSFFEEEEMEISETMIPNIYSFYQSRKMIQSLTEVSDAGIRIARENLEGIERLALINADHIVRSYTDIDMEEERYSTPAVLKFPSHQVEQFEEINQLLFREDHDISSQDANAPISRRGSLGITPENYVKISINSSQAGIINNFLKSNNLDLSILEYMTGNARREIPTAMVLDDNFITNPLNPDRQGRELRITNNDVARENVRNSIYRGFVPNAFDGPSGIINKISEDEIDIREYPLYYNGWDNKQLLFLDTFIQKHIFFDQLASFIQESGMQRTFMDILNGNKCYSEVVGYKVLKYEVLSEEEQANVQSILDIDRAFNAPFAPRELAEPRRLVQTFYFMDSDKVKQFEYIDSQVRPGTVYQYEINTINLVIANNYQYVTDDSVFGWRVGNELRQRGNPEDLSKFQIHVTSDREVCLCEAPFFKKTIRPVDHPPLAPQINWIPYRGFDDRIGILFTVNYGEEEENKISVDFQEEDYMSVFKMDSLPDAFEWSRIEHAPESYSDFREATQGIVPATGKTGFSLQSLIPNKYYYYTFRTIDNYDFEAPNNPNALYSNPSEVYRLRIVSYDNGVFVEVEAYEMYTKPKEFKKNFENVLKIRPSFRQRIINFDRALQDIEALPNSAIENLRRELGLVTLKDSFEFKKTAPQLDKIMLGPTPQEEALWGRKFKFRIKSKSTGKTIDLNIDFKRS